ncbi:lipid IV(A) palmitoyltransferase PagP [Escherichia coli]
MSKYVAIFSFVFIQLISVGKVFANAVEWMTTFEKILHKPGNSLNIMIYIFLPSPGMHVSLTTKKKPIAITSDRGVAVLACRVGMKRKLAWPVCHGVKSSWNKWEPIAGYGWESTWRPLADENFHLGLGFTAGVTARDNWNYIPLPVLLPLASVGYGPVTFQMTYIPGTYNNGNVYFAWMRFQF